MRTRGVRYWSWHPLAIALLALASASVAEDRRAPFEYMIVKIRVGNLEESLKYYGTFFGYKEVLRTPASKTGQVQVYMSRGGENFRDGLTLVHEPGKQAPSDPGALHTLVFSVRDIVGSMRAIESAGYKIKRPPTETTRYPSALTSAAVIGYTVDPNGYPVEIVEWKP